MLDQARNEHVSGTLGRVQIEGDGQILVKGLPGKGQENNETDIDSASELSLKALGEKDPTAKALYDVRKGIKTHMPDGPEKYNAIKAARLSQKELLEQNGHIPDEHTEGSDSLPAISGNNGSSIKIEGHITKVGKLENNPLGWFEAAQKIAQLPLDKQLQVLGTGLGAGITEYDRQYRERSIGAIIGSVQGVGNIATNLGNVADFSAYLLLNDHDRASKMGSEFGDALGETIVSGFKLFEGAHLYLNDVGKAGYQGDYTKVFRDVANLGEHLDKAWSELPPREQARIVSKLGTELAGESVIGIGTAKSLGKVPKFTEILDTVADGAQKLHKSGKVISGKTLQVIDEAIDPVVDQLLGRRFAHASPYGGEIRTGFHGVEEIVKDSMNLEMSTKRRFTSKLDPSVRLKPIDAAKENAQIKGQKLDRKKWDKLDHNQKAEVLTKEHGYDEILDYERPVKQHIVESELEQLKKRKVKPIEVEEGQKRVDNLRDSFEAPLDDNIAIAQFDIDGEIDSMASLNGLTSPKGTAPRPKQRKFDIDPKYDGSIDHSNDSEVKILEEIAARIKKNSKGVINLYTERPPCDSCEDVIDLFEDMFRGVDVIVRHNPAME